MAHNINTYIGRQSAWHKLGTVTGVFMTWADILAHGGLDFDVFKSQLHDGRGKPVNAWGTFRWNKADKAMRDASKAEFLGTVGEDYKVINHASGFELIDALMQTADGAHYETAGVLGAGETVWGLADLNLSYQIGDDKHKAYILFCTSHDGSYSYQLRAVDERVVCNNTLDIALAEKTKSAFKIRHTKNALVKVDDAHKALANLTADVRTVEQKLQFLAGRKITRESLETIMARLYPVKVDDDGQKVDSTRRNNMLAEIMANYERNDQNAFPEQRGSAYNLLNAITEHTDHQRSSRGDQRAQSAMFGSGNQKKNQAMQVIMEGANGMPELRTQTIITTSTVKQPVSVARKPVVGTGSVLDAILADAS